MLLLAHRIYKNENVNNAQNWKKRGKTGVFIYYEDSPAFLESNLATTITK